ncbi:MAG: 50S ribosomal protein L29 [Candidatus Hydrothermarchaeota archaeon]
MTLKADEIRDMSLEDMEEKLKELRFELARDRAIVAAGGAFENPGRIRSLKRTIARILTIMEEVKKREGEKE